VAPDNGVLSPLPAEALFYELPIPADAAPTFHGRDVFAPAAASLANGTALAQLPLFAPRAGFADRVMAQVKVPKTSGGFRA